MNKHFILPPDRLRLEDLHTVPPIVLGDRIEKLFDFFFQNPSETLCPIVDTHGKSIGIIRESDLRRYAYSLYGRELMKNHTQRRELSDFLVPCPVADIHNSLEQLLSVFVKGQCTEGILIDDKEHYRGFLTTSTLIKKYNEFQITDLERINQSYQRFIPKQFLQLLNKEHITEVQLGDCIKKEMTILFSDIRSFTSLSEQMSPQENFNFLNSYLQRMEPAVVDHNGFIDKYIGDGLMALFEGSPDNAIQSGLTMLKTLREYNQHRAKMNYRPIQIGIGINTGQVMLGTIGGQRHMAGTAISDAVNLAARTEALTKEYRVPLLISGGSYINLTNPQELSVRMIDWVCMKGKKIPVAIFEVFELDPPEIKEAKHATMERFEEGLYLYQTYQYLKAQELFKECLKKSPNDTVLHLYLMRCSELKDMPVEQRNLLLDDPKFLSRYVWEDGKDWNPSFSH